MAYERLNLKTGDELNEEVFKRIDDGIEGLYNDFYNKKITTETILTAETADLSSPTFSKSYPNVGGLASVIGKPSVISTLKFPVRATTTSGEITGYTCSIYELPDDPNISPFSIILGEKTVTLDEPITATNRYTVAEVNFDTSIVNTNNKYLLARIWFGGNSFKVDLGLNDHTFDDIPYNPGWFYCASTGNGTPSKATNSNPADVDDANSKLVRCIAMHTYSVITSETDTPVLDTSKDGRFFELVEESVQQTTLATGLFNSKTKGLQLISHTLRLNGGISSSSFDRSYPNVGGLATVIGNPDAISAIKFPVQPSASGEITSFMCTIYELPDDSSVSPFSKVLTEKVVVLDEPISDTSKYTIVEVSFDEAIVNTNKKFLLARLFFGGKSFKVNLGLSNVTFSDIPYNPGWFYCTSTGDGTPSKAVDMKDPASKEIRCMAIEIYYSPNKKIEYYIDTSPEGKFAQQVYSVIEQSGGSLPEGGGTQPGSGRLAPIIYLPKQYDVVVGDTFQLFYASIVRSFEWDNEGVCAVSSVGYNYPRYYEFTPTESHSGKSYNLRIVARALDGTITCEATTKLVVHPKLTNETTPSNLNVLCFGDSLTAAGTWCSEGLRRIYGTSTSASGPASLGVTNTVTTYGAKSNTNNTFKVQHEGYGGWTWKSFVTAERGSDSTTNGIVVTLDVSHGYDLNTVQKSVWIDNNGLLWELEDFPSENQIKFNRGDGNSATQANTATPTSLSYSALNYTITPTIVVWESSNPFYNAATETVDFVAHAEKYGNPGADIVACLLTWNSTGSSLQFEKIPTAIEKHMADASALFRIIHNDLPNAKIVVMGLTPCSMTGGRGYNGGAQAGVADRFSGLFYAMEYSKALEELCNDAEFSGYCYYCDTKGQFDAIYGMPYTQKAVNTRSTETEMFGTNGVHPNTTGYYQIGDAFYRALTKVIPIAKAAKEAATT